MKFYYVIIALLLIPIVHASIYEWNNDISINTDGTTQWVVTLNYDQNVSKSDYFVLSRITYLEILADGSPIKCSISNRDIGTSIICNNINAKTVIYKFNTEKISEKLSDVFKLTYRMSVTQTTDKFFVTLHLPLGAALVEKSKIEGFGLQRFEPSWGSEGSDGRRIILEWKLNEPKLGETFNISVIYELLSSQIDSNYIIVVILAIFLAGAVVSYFYIKRPRIQNMLPVLTEQERKVVEMVINDKEIDQRKIVKETQYSKSKISRIITDLEKRGVVEKTPKGRTNIIRLKKLDLKPKNTENKQDEIKRQNIGL